MNIFKSFISFFRPKKEQGSLSSPQKRIWLLSQDILRNPLYNMPFAVRITGSIDLKALKKSFNGIIMRHKILRASFNDDTSCTIDSSLKFKLKFCDLSSASEKDEFLRKILEREILEPFDLTTPPLFRAILIQLNEKEHVLLWVIHSIIADKESIVIIWNEIASLYNAFHRGNRPSIEELPVQYSDFIYNFIKEDKPLYREQLEYWLHELKEAPALTELPIDYSRPATQSYKGNANSFSISKALTEQLQELSQQEGVTLFLTLLTAFYIFIYRHIGVSDLVVGSLIDRRQGTKYENLVGQFVNILPLRATLDGQCSFREILKQIKQKTFKAYENKDLSFENLLETLPIERTLRHAPLVQIIFDLHKKEEYINLDDLNVAIEQIQPQMTPFDIVLEMTESKDGLTGFLRYASDLFQPITIERFIQRFTTLIESILKDPNNKIDLLEIISKEEKEKILIEWNNTQKDYSLDRTVINLFEDQAEKAPQQLAIIFGEQSLTYNELNEKANKVAHDLISKGIGPGSIVLICLERSLEYVICLLGILKAGGAYLPLDPTVPKERVETIINDAKPSLIIGDLSLSQKLINIKGMHFFDISQRLETNKCNPKIHINSDNLAYMIFTSGSTGKPKGTLISHRNLTNLLLATQERISIDPKDRFLHNFAFTFDAAVVNLWWPLMAGATVILLSLEGMHDLSYQINLILKHQCTIIPSTPAGMSLILEQKDILRGGAIRIVTSGGEALKKDLYKLELELPHCRVFNVYGPTECTVNTTIYEVTNQTETPVAPIGTPISNYQVYILDKYLNPVPIGVPGELCVGGVGVGKGYLNRPDLTKEKFIQNPFNPDPTSVLYKTGDLVRWLPEGNIDLLGRIDFQVKIRGFRIELEEIETILQSYPYIKEALVMARDDLAVKGPQLVAYFTLREGMPPLEELKNFLMKNLPAYMIPSHFVPLKKFPINVNGKIDRKALPAPQIIAAETALQGPKNATEEMLFKIWKDLLNTNQISIQDNFFDLGGNSLLVTKLVYRLQDKFNVKLTLMEFYRHPTISALAELIDKPKRLEDSTLLDIQRDRNNARQISLSPGKLNPANQMKAVLLTGATGFLGPFLLKELLNATKATIFCLVRGNDNKKFLANLSKYNLLQFIDLNRVKFIYGDFLKPFLGLSPEQYESLAEEIDTIYHNGASVHHLYDYSMLRNANVLGTMELLKLAGWHHPKRMHFVSSLVATLDRDKEDDIPEHFPVTDPTGTESGYTLSKWVAEKILEDSIQRGFTVSVYRPGQILGDTITGATPTENYHFSLLLKGCNQLGFAPKLSVNFNMIPVDTVAKIITQLSLQEENANKVFNTCNPRSPSLEEVFQWMIEYGYPLKLVEFDEWQKNLSNVTEKNALYPLLPFYLSTDEKKFISDSPLAKIDKIEKLIENKEIQFPIIDKALFFKYFTFFEDWFID